MVFVMSGHDASQDPAGNSATTLYRRSLQLFRGIAEISNLLLEWLQRSRERRQLDGLSDHMLKDMGVSRADAEQEVAKPFWQP
jgi:uncharacterized protein YjiS (DUF1127 family)